MHKDMKSRGSHCGYMGNCWQYAYRAGIFIVFVLLIGGIVDAFIQAAPQHAIMAAVISIILILVVTKVKMKGRFMRRVLELKLAKFVPDIYVTPDEKTKSLIVHVTASKHASCVLKHVWECEDVSPDAPDSGSCSIDKDIVKMKLPVSIKMGSELAIKLPMPAMKGKMDDEYGAKFGIKLYIPMLSRKIVAKICPYSYCVCYHIVPCGWSKDIAAASTNPTYKGR